MWIHPDSSCAGCELLSSSSYRGTPCEQIELRILGKPEIPNTEDEKAEKNMFYFQLDKTCCRFSKQIDADFRFDPEFCAAKDRTRRIQSCVT